MFKVLTIFGTRPEAIKMAPVIKELDSYKSEIRSLVVVTAQHRETLDDILDIFAIKPHYDLNIMQPGQNLFQVTSRVLLGLESILSKERPDIVLVQGDTTTTFSASLAAFYLKIPVGHLEAGLRTYNRHDPFPEEINRRITSNLAELHFTPTANSRDNLVKEGIDKESIFITGNTVIDALFQTISPSYRFRNRVLKEIDFHKTKVILVTTHRRESLGSPLDEICWALKRLIELHGDIEIIYPVHRNPKVRDSVKKILGDTKRVYLMDPLDYQEFVHLMDRSYLILTDSGGIQEEAPSLGKPVLVLRDTTERPEAVKTGSVKLIGRDQQRIIAETSNLLKHRPAYEKMAREINLYGNGGASKRIVEILKKYYRENRLVKGG